MLIGVGGEGGTEDQPLPRHLQHWPQGETSSIEKKIIDLQKILFVKLYSSGYGKCLN